MLTCEILFSPLEHKIHIFSPPCIILYILIYATCINYCWYGGTLHFAFCWWSVGTVITLCHIIWNYLAFEVAIYSVSFALYCIHYVSFKLAVLVRANEAATERELWSCFLLRRSFYVLDVFTKPCIITIRQLLAMIKTWVYSNNNNLYVIINALSKHAENKIMNYNTDSWI